MLALSSLAWAVVETAATITHRNTLLHPLVEDDGKEADEVGGGVEDVEEEVDPAGEQASGRAAGHQGDPALLAR